jgi:sec-independent protein translocase protein TatC
MANPSSLPEPEEEGGPVKSFLEHLEDLRWTLVKSLTAIVIAVVVCLLAGRYLVAFMVWPLHNSERLFQSEFFQKRDPTHIPVLLGTNLLGQVMWSELGLPEPATNHVTAIRLAPVMNGTNYVLTLQPETTPRKPETPTLVVLKNYSPIEGIVVALKLSLYGGLVLSAPLVFLFVGQFVLPALKVTEKRILYNAVGVGAGLFVLGVVFCYVLVSVFALGATIQFSNWLGFTADEWRADAYISFMSKFMLGMGLAFEMPVVILTLVKIGILEYEQLKRFRSYALVCNLVVSAFVTPSGDPVTMLILAIPLHMLYEISVLIAGVWARRDARAAAQG